MCAAEKAVDALLQGAHLAAAHEMPALIARHVAELGGQDAVIHLVDLQQTVLVPFVGSSGPSTDSGFGALSIDGTVAGRAYQHVEVLTQAGGGEGTVRVWLPLLDGTERLGVLGVTVADFESVDEGELLLA